MRPKRKPDIPILIRQGAGEIIRAEAQSRCSFCSRTTPASYILVQPENDWKICPQCVATAFVDLLPAEAQHWQPSEVLEMLQGDAQARIRGICACLKYGEKPTRSLWYVDQWETLPLGASEEVFRRVVACISFPGDSREAGLVRLLACWRALDMLAKKRFTDMILEVSPKAPPEMILGAAEVVLASAMGAVDKLRWLCAFAEHPDPCVAAGLEDRIKRLGYDSFDTAGERLRSQDAVTELTQAFKADELKALAKTVQRISGESVPGTSKEDIAAGLVQLFGTPQKVVGFYKKLSQPVKDAVNFMAWRKGGIPPEKIQQAVGFSVVVKKEERYYGVRFSVLPKFEGLLFCRQKYQGEHCEIHLHPWLREKLKPALPRPQKAHYQGTEEPPAVAAGCVLSTAPAFANLLPAIDAMCQQDVIPRKKNGEPTIVGLRSVRAAGGEIGEFYPDDPDLGLKRCQMLIGLGDAAPPPATPRTEPGEVLKAWLDPMVRPSKTPGGKNRRKDGASHDTILTSLVGCIKGALSYGGYDPHAAICLSSLAAAVKALPAGQWITVADVREFMLYNNLELPVPGCFFNAHVSVAARWGQLRIPVPAATDVLWEEPLLRGYLLVLVAVGMLDAVVAPPENAGYTLPGKKYLVVADGLCAVRLNALGQWYFQDGPADIFEARDGEGAVILDERRLLLRLAGRNPVLEIALKQVAQPLGGGFHRIDGGSFLKDCGSQALLERKIAALKSLLPDRIPPVWQAFFDSLIARINPLKPVKYAVLEIGESAEFRRLLVSDQTLKSLVVMAEGGRILVKSGDGAKLKRRLKELGYFVDNF